MVQSPSAPLGTDAGSIDRAEIGLTPEQRALRRAVREFARAEIAPKVDELERTGTYPRELVREVGRLGYLGCLIPPEYGGAGLEDTSHGIVCEEAVPAAAGVWRVALLGLPDGAAGRIGPGVAVDDGGARRQRVRALGREGV